jgi:iron(III) transport system substrate-binding protein
MQKKVLSLLVFSCLSIYRFAVAAAQDPAIIAAAKKEGEVFFYTGKNLATMQSVANAFESKYPFLKVRITRTSGEKLINRIRTEQLAGRFLFDAVSAAPVPILESFNAIQPYCSPEAKAFASQFRHPTCMWTGIVGNYYVIVYNTKMVSKEDVPRDWHDLTEANRKSKGQIAIDPEEYSWLAGMEGYLGEERTKKLMTGLARQDIRWQKGHNNIADLLAAGEFPFALSYATRTEEMRSKGAPMDWVKTTKPIVVDPHNLAMAARPVHPNAAKLWIDFLLSNEGQTVLFKHKEAVFRSGVVPQGSSLNPANLELAAVPAKIFAKTTFMHYQAKFDELFGPRR